MANDKNAMMSAYALCPDELSHPERMEWIAAKFRELADREKRANVTPVAWAGVDEDGKVECLGMNQSRRFDTPLYMMAALPAQAAAPAQILTPETVWIRLIAVMEQDNGCVFPTSVGQFARAQPSISALISAGFFAGDWNDLDGDYWIAVAGGDDEAITRFPDAFSALNEVLNEVFDSPMPPMAAPVQAVAPDGQPRPSDDELWDQTLRARDEYHEMADQLAARIAAISGAEIGEHSSANNPWRAALLAADEWIAIDARGVIAGRPEQAAQAVAPSEAQPVAWACWFDSEDPDTDTPTIARLEPHAYGQRRPLVYAAPQAVEPAAPQAVPDAQPVAWMHQCRKKPALKSLSFRKVDPRLQAQGYKAIPLYAAQPAAQPADAQDAARWRALIGCARIRPIGSAGIEQPDPDHHAHLGLELWTRFGRDYRPELLVQLDQENARGRRWLTAFADIAIDAARTQGGAES